MFKDIGLLLARPPRRLRAQWATLMLPTILLAVHVCAGSMSPGQSPSNLASQPRGPSESLVSASAAARFWEIGCDLLQSPGITNSQADQAVILLAAAKSLNPKTEGIEPLLLQLAVQHSNKDYSQHVLLWLRSYVNETADWRLVAKAVQYLLDRRPAPEDRRKLLEGLVTQIGNRNTLVDSELATMLGLVVLEQGDRNAAKFYFVEAYRKNKYNSTAFSKLAELAPDEIGQAPYLEHLRLIVRRNPLDLEAALAFAQYCERLQLYDVAVGAYQYCAELFQHLHPTEPLPARIYLPWAVTGYNSTRQLSVPQQVTQAVRASGRFDLLLESVAGKAAAKAGKTEESQQILAQAEQTALQSLENQTPQPGTLATGDLGAKQMAWFYCFGLPSPAKALDWANRAFAADPNSQISASLLAYALGMTAQWDLVQKIVGPNLRNQITEITLAQLQISQANREEAKKLLRSAISRDPGSFGAEQARSLLTQLGEKYPDPDLTAVTALLTRSFGQMLVPHFMAPGNMIETQLSVQGTAFAYGQDIPATVVVINKSPEPLVITDNSLFTGRIRVDARTSGHLAATFPALISQTLGSQVEVPPGRGLTAPIRLSTGGLRRLLVDHPQALLAVEFTLYLDPVETDGAVRCAIPDIKPAVAVVNRPAVEIDGASMRNHFNTLFSGSESQKTLTAQLFVGLLGEQAMMTKQGPVYPYRYADWMRDMLRSALVNESGLLSGTGPDQWVLKVHTMADMIPAPDSMAIDQQLSTILARNLSDPQWPVRLMALYLLSTTSSGGGFDKMLGWVAQQETNELVRSMALALRPAK